MEEIKYKNIIEIIYNAEEKILDEKIKQAIKDIDVENILENTSKPKELKKILEQIEENYSIKIAQYNKEFYEQGFIDGVNLIINCTKENQ